MCNRLAVGAATVFVATLALGAGPALWQMHAAIAQRDLAAYQQQRATAGNEFLSLLLEDVGAADKPRTLAGGLDRSTALLERQYDGNQRVYASMLYEASRLDASIGNTDRELLLDKVTATARRLGDADLLASSQCPAAWMLVDQDRAAATGRFAEATRALAGATRAAASAHFVCARAQARMREAAGDAPGAIATLRQALQPVPGAAPLPVSFELVAQVEAGGAALIGFAGHLATSLLRLGRYEEALRLAETDAARARQAGNHRMASIDDLVAARTLGKLRRFEEGRATLARAEAGQPTNAKAKQRLLQQLALTRADQLLLKGEHEAARRAVETVLQRLGYPEKRMAPGLGSALHAGVRVRLAQGADRWSADSLVIARRLTMDAARSADVGQAELKRALGLAQLGRANEATTHAALARTALHAGFGPRHPDTQEADRLLASLQAADPPRR